MSSSADGPRTKLEEQATAKADLSYSYFHAKIGSSSETPAPRLLSEVEAQAQQERERQHGATGGSVWNQAGTFEERSATSWAKERLKEMLQGLEHNGVTVTGMGSITGDANIWLVRGKRRHGFAFEISLSWKAEVGSSTEITGNVKIPNADVDDIEDITLEPEVLHKQPERAQDEAVALASVMKLKGPIEQVLAAFFEELKQK